MADLTLAQLIELAKPTNADEIAQCQALVGHPAASKTVIDLLAGAEHPVAVALHETAVNIVHTAETVFSAIEHFGGEEIGKLEDLLKGHPNREPDLTAHETESSQVGTAAATQLGSLSPDAAQPASANAQLEGAQ